jgi:guanosine-diphosphatase
MIDAGSTGSRIHVYRFNNCGTTPELEDEVFEQTAKKEGGSGLSSYREDAEGAAKSLDPLMDVAMKHVPDNIKSCTPVAVKATAGLRKLGPEMSNAILKAVRHRLETAYPFPVVAEEKGGVEVMDGKDEGVYAWITTNYLLGKIGGPDKTPTAAVFDLGGGSTQIVFQPTFKTAGGGMPETLAEGDHKYELNFGGRKFTLYQHSYLGYGLMAARENLHKVVIEAMHEENGSNKAWLENPVLNPCITPGMSRDVTVEMGKGHALGESVKVKMTGPKEGAPAQCRALAEKTLKKDAECKLRPCAFNGVHQPSLDKTFAREDVYLFSYFYDRTQPLGMPESFTLRELKDLAHRVCHGESMWDVFHSVKGAMEELKGRPESCLDLNFMFALLHTGYEMPMEREVKIAKKIKGNELGWCLGARYVPFHCFLPSLFPVGKLANFCH